MSSGGKREGAGRPRKDTVAIQIRVSPDVAELLRQQAKAAGVTTGEVVTRICKKEFDL
jgi:hypothetical protein